MFRLDEQISTWCRAVAERARMSTVEIEELRDHLVTEVQRQQSLGASEEKAFELATARLGSIDDLSKEYAKNRKIGRAVTAVANVPYGTRILGAYLLTIACLMSFLHITTFINLFVSGGERSPDFQDTTILAFVGYAVWMWAPFVWGGVAGRTLLLGRALGPGRLFGLVALIAVQVPVLGAQPLPAFELSGGLQLTLLLGPVEELFRFQALSDIHLNAPASGPHYFGINLIAMTAFVFTLTRLVDCVSRNDARVRATQALG
jgi:hypothetical protein